MDTVLVILIALAVTGLLFFMVARRKPTALPEARPEKATLPTDATEPAGPAPSKKTEQAALAEGTAQASKTSRTEIEPEAASAKPEQTSPGAVAAASQPLATVPETSGPTAHTVAPSQRAPASHEDDVAALRKGLASTRGGFIARLARLFGSKKDFDPSVLEEIEEVLITADVGVKTTQRIIDELRERMRAGRIDSKDGVWAGIRDQAEAILALDPRPLRLGDKPAVVLIAGVNGVGKTTTIGKLAARLRAEGKRVLLAAGDTYRAAAVLQLEMWGKRVDCPVVTGKENADPSSVIFEAIRKATDEGFDVVLADTAGRLHTKQPLMDELRKVDRTIAKARGGRGADEIFLVLDSTTGQNAVQQTHMFREALDVTGIVLTKLDGTAKGGVILGIVDQHKIPVRFIGLGERVEDLREFDAHTFVEALFAKPDDATLAA